MKHVVVTGASSGFGAAIASRLHREGCRLSLGARRVERLAALGLDGSFEARLDVTDPDSVAAFLAGARAAHGAIDVLVNNAGLARGVETIATATGAAWREMVETNLLGVFEVTRAAIGEMIERGSGHVVMIGSIAGHESYEGGSVYCATKRGLRSFTEALRYETLGTGIRVTSVDPGLAETEFSIVRFRGDQAKARSIYAGTRPLTADDIADCVAFAVSRPAHVNIDSMVVMPTDQASPKRVHRRS